MDWYVIISIIVSTRILVLFLFVLFEYLDLTGVWKSMIQIGTQSNLSKELIESVSVSIPSKDEQIKIAAFFKKIDDEIDVKGKNYTEI